jgi:hypothetical protein
VTVKLSGVEVCFADYVVKEENKQKNLACRKVFLFVTSTDFQK